MSILGSVICFGLNSLTLGTHDLAVKLDEAGLDTGLIKHTKRDRSNVVRALRDLEEGGFLRHIREDKERAVYLLVGERIAGDDASYHTEVRFVYRKKERDVVADVPAQQQRIDALIKHHGETQSTADIRAVLIRALDQAHAVKLRPDGGAYFLLAEQNATRDALAKFCRDNGGWTTLLDVPKDAGNAREMFEALERDKLGELETLEGELERAAGRMGGPRGVRDTTWDGMLERFDEVQASLETYARVLELKAEKATRRLEVARLKVEALKGVVK